TGRGRWASGGGGRGAGRGSGPRGGARSRAPSVACDRSAPPPPRVQAPPPPILVGGSGPTVHERVLAYGDAWFPNRIPPDDSMIERIEQLQRLAGEAGRGRIPVSLQIPPRDASALERYEQAGVTRAVPMLRAGAAASRDSAERKLDEWLGRIQAYR